MVVLTECCFFFFCFFFAVDLQATSSKVTAHSNDTEVELACEMTLYIRPDEDLQWFRGSEMIVNGTGRHTVSYRNGSVRAAQYGGDTLIPGRVSVLTISNPQQSDSGTYTCRILGTEQSANVQLSVEGVFPATPTPSVTATVTPSVTPVSSGATLSTDIKVVTTIVGLVVLATIISVIPVFVKSKEIITSGIAEGYLDYLY